MSEPAVTPFVRLAEAPLKDRLLKALDLLRAEVERDEIIGMVVLSIRTDSEFHVSSWTDLRMATLAGMLGRAHLDALEALRAVRN